MSGSPQSTLSGIGSWSSNGSPAAPSSQVPSPPTTPFGGQNDTWDLIYAAAGQVARLKMNSVDGAAKFGNNNGRGLLGPPSTPSPSLPCVQNQSPFTQVRTEFSFKDSIFEVKAWTFSSVSDPVWGFGFAVSANETRPSTKLTVLCSLGKIYEA